MANFRLIYNNFLGLTMIFTLSCGNDNTPPKFPKKNLNPQSEDPYCKHCGNILICEDCDMVGRENEFEDYTEFWDECCEDGYCER